MCGKFWSPEPANAVLIEECFNRDEDEVTRKCLGYQYPVERVAKGTLQRAGARGFLDGYGQFFEVLVGYGGGNVRSYGHGFIQSAPVVFRSYLPRGGCADEYGVRIVADGAACPPRQSFAPVHPPDEGMGVKQDPQLRTAFP